LIAVIISGEECLIVQLSLSSSFLLSLASKYFPQHSIFGHHKCILCKIVL
jgi:hypothetical protein